MSDGGVKESDRAGLLLIGEDLGEGDAGSIIDGDVNILPSRAADAIAPIVSDAMTWALDASELFDVEVEQFAWMSALVAARRRASAAA